MGDFCSCDCMFIGSIQRPLNNAKALKKIDHGDFFSETTIKNQSYIVTMNYKESEDLYGKR